MARRHARGRKGLVTLAAALAFGMVASGHAVPPLTPQVLAEGVVINIPQHRLFLMRGGVAVASYPVGLGRPDWPTFVGPFTIVVKEIDPTWDVPVSIQEEQRRSGKPVLTRVPPGPSNPLGTYWIGLSVPGYGIHGTNAPASIGKFQSHGCVRMLPADIEDLFARVDVGAPGLSAYVPVIVGVVDEGVWVEAHRDVYRLARAVDVMAFVRSEVARLAPTAVVDWQIVARVLHDRRGTPQRVGTVGTP